MQSFLTPSNITFAVGMITIMFGVYRYFKDPQNKLDKRDALLSQQMEFMNQANEARFKTMQDSFNSLLLQSNNHIHTVDTKVENLTNITTAMGKDIVHLSTIIEERIPKH